MSEKTSKTDTKKNEEKFDAAYAFYSFKDSLLLRLKLEALLE